MNRISRALSLCFLMLLLPGGASAADERPFSQPELDAMLAPIALYPDSVLSHVLIAATYPLEIVQAARWSRDNPGLDGELAVAAAEEYDWDPSVQALTAFPELLARMDEDIQWTQSLGEAFLIQEADVIASIQDLRNQAYAQGHLRSNDQVRVVRETRYIYIEPARTRTVYVPVYDPYLVYGSWRWQSYPPVYWDHPRYVSGVSLYWGTGYRIRPTFYFSAFHWSRSQVVVVHHHHYPTRHFRSSREIAHYRQANHWRHDPHHRRGVSYRRQVEAQRFVERSSAPQRSTARATSASVSRNSARAVSEQRRWAASQRSNIDLHSTATGRTVDRASTRRQTAAVNASTRPQPETRPAATTERRAAARERVASAPAQRASGRSIPRRTQSAEASRSQQVTRRLSSPESAPRRSTDISAIRAAPRRSTPSERVSALPGQSAPRSMPSRPQTRSPEARSRAPQSAPARMSVPARSSPVRTAPARSMPSPALRSAVRSSPERRSAAPSASRSDARARVQSRSRDGSERQR